MMSPTILGRQMVVALTGITGAPPSPYTALYFNTLASSLVLALRKEIKVGAMLTGVGGSPGMTLPTPGAFSSLQSSMYVTSGKRTFSSAGLKVDAGGKQGTTAFLSAIGAFFTHMGSMGSFILTQADVGMALSPPPCATGVAMIKTGDFMVDDASLGQRFITDLLAAGFGNQGKLGQKGEDFHKTVAKSIKEYLTTASFMGTAPIVSGIPIVPTPPPAAGTLMPGNYIF